MMLIPLAALLMAAQSPTAQASEPVTATWASLPYVEFPEAAIGATTRGVVAMTCDIGTDGAGRRCEVESEEPPGLGFGEAALAASPRFRFEPVMRDGRPVEERGRLRIVFAANDLPEIEESRRAPPRLQRALSMFDRLGFYSGVCAAHLAPARRAELEAGLKTFEASGRPLPAFDQALFGAYGRGKANPPTNLWTGDYCRDALKAMQDDLKAESDLIAQVEAELPSQARRQ